MRRVCARCGDVGHMATACSAEYCKRCAYFAHDTVGAMLSASGAEAGTQRRRLSQALVRTSRQHAVPALQQRPGKQNQNRHANAGVVIEPTSIETRTSPRR
ncbi:hypothetical protein HPB52_021148 [Rhipicephalus sanguineus]|uniref:CCHC-type domain-containing protein n=1 Tax=Rhipicephalus sanguineus TaxID=34632 RepID=A0A9D4PXM5_RHISA|nr:hypothetical protein HPB52_021148 [Rhipicephalus sanguineus]